MNGPGCRVANGRAPLQVSVSLTNAAKWMSNDMATMNRFNHSDSLGRTFGVRLNAFSYGFPTPDRQPDRPR